MMHNHPHPGKLLREDVLVPLDIEVTEVARRLGMSRTSLSRVIHGHAGVSTARFWMTLQTNYELSRAEQREQPNVMPLQTTHST